MFMDTERKKATMFKKFGNFVKVSLLVLTIITQSLSASAALAQGNSHDKDFVKQAGPELRLNSKEFRFAGTNNYYLMYKSQFMVDDVLTTAAAQGFTVMRMWGSLDIGNQDGSNSINGKSDGIYFQYWNGTAPAYNDGADGLQKLDYAVYKAGQEGLKVVIPFVNNWNAFGGIDQYVRWAGGQYHDQFYTDPVIKDWYKNWISHLLNHTNSYSGIQYKNDPTIMTWELANEPRCLSAGAYPRSSSCNTQTLIHWADEMSTFIKHIDSNHLVSVGDEGFYCTDPNSTDWTENCGEGVDTLAFTRLKNIDVMSYHLYPEPWGKDTAWGTEWIKRHSKEAKKIGKPSMLGEFGITDKSIRNPTYKKWTDTVLDSGGAGALYWILSGQQDGGALYPDYDGLTVYCPSPECITLHNFAAMMTARKSLVFPPVADNDSAMTQADTSVIFNPLANDIAYGSAQLAQDSIDLDPSTAGQQTTQSAYGGTYASQPNGSVTFTPASGFNGKSQITYTVEDSQGRLSNIAVLAITVNPSPTGPTTLYSFESGTEGWGPASWDIHGTVAQSTTSATEGTHSLQIDSTGGWFVVEPSPALDLSMGGQYVRLEINASSATSTKLSFSTGSGWFWQESNTLPLSAGDNSVGIDLTTGIGGGALADANEVHRIAIYLNPGTYFLDYVRLDHTAPPPPPPPSSTLTLYSFETGVEGWGPASWDPHGTTAQSSAFHTDGANGLQVVTTGDGWFGLDMPVAADLAGKTHLKFDLQTTGIGTSMNVALKLGGGWTWCQGSWGWVNPGTTTTVDLDLLTLSDGSNPCSVADLNQVHAIFVFFSGGGTFYLDNVRGE
jgi:mannan endo-1,4-beta-mannosidase